LRLGHSKKPEALAALVNIVRGDPARHLRFGSLNSLLVSRIISAQVGEMCADVEQQVLCLLEQATDPNILGRSWGGWEPWI
jgi:DNA-dependent protein kinase catalytic subunit